METGSGQSKRIGQDGLWAATERPSVEVTEDASVQGRKTYSKKRSMILLCPFLKDQEDSRSAQKLLLLAIVLVTGFE